MKKEIFFGKKIPESPNSMYRVAKDILKVDDTYFVSEFKIYPKGTDVVSIMNGDPVAQVAKKVLDQKIVIDYDDPKFLWF